MLNKESWMQMLSTSKDYLKRRYDYTHDTQSVTMSLSQWVCCDTAFVMTTADLLRREWNVFLVKYNWCVTVFYVDESGFLSHDFLPKYCFSCLPSQVFPQQVDLFVFWSTSVLTTFFSKRKQLETTMNLCNCYVTRQLEECCRDENMPVLHDMFNLKPDFAVVHLQSREKEQTKWQPHRVDWATLFSFSVWREFFLFLLHTLVCVVSFFLFFLSSVTFCKHFEDKTMILCVRETGFPSLACLQSLWVSVTDLLLLATFVA